MKRPNPLLHGAIKTARDPLKPYIVATIACAGAAWLLFNLSEKAAPASPAAAWIETTAHAFAWISASAAISHVVLFAIYLLRDARSAPKPSEPPSQR